MISLARANLIHDWRRHSTAIVVLVLAGLLMTIQLGLVYGYINSQTAMVEQTRADLVVESLSYSIPERHEAAILMHPEVVEAKPFHERGNIMRWHKASGETESITLHVVDPSQGSINYPLQFSDNLRKILATPGVLVLTRAAAKSVDVKLGDKERLGEADVIVGAIVDGLSSPFSPRVFASSQTARLIGTRASSFNPKKYLIKLKNPERAEQTLSELNQLLQSKGLIVKKLDGVAKASGISAIFNGTGLIFMGSAIFALLVGCGIASQTLRAAFLAQIKEFASLRALGVRRFQLVLISMEQAFWTGLASILPFIFLSFLIQKVGAIYEVSIALPSELLIGCSLLLLLVAMVAGLISLTAVTKSQPAELLR